MNIADKYHRKTDNDDTYSINVENDTISTIVEYMYFTNILLIYLKSPNQTLFLVLAISGIA